MALLAPARAMGQALPSLPQATLDTTYAPPSGRTIAVPAGGDVQAALDSAKPGDLITLVAGATFRGPFTLPKKAGQGWIVIRTDAPDGDLPPPGTRVNLSFAKVMPKLVAASSPVIRTAPGAHHFRFVGIEVTPVAGHFVYNLVQLGAGETRLSALPHDIVFDRCYLHGDPLRGARRGIAVNAARVAVIDSYLVDFKEVGADSQAIAAWNGPGPFKIVNNYLEAAGENVLFGGADPSIPNLIPSDIELRQNHFFKPLSWRVGDPSYAGTHWSVKNLLELKNAQRVLIEGNIFENNWGDGQAGFAILFTVRNQGGTAPWSVVQDVTFRYNIVLHTASAVNILGTDDLNPSQPTQRLLIQHNLFEDVNGTAWNGDGRLFQLLRGPAHVTIDHNTGFQTGPIIMAEGTPATGFVYRNNLTLQGNYGVIGTNTAPGKQTLATYFPGAVFAKNVLVGANASDYPHDNYVPATLDAVGFVKRSGGDYRLSASSPYKNAGTHGKDLGVDCDVLYALTGSARVAAPAR